MSYQTETNICFVANYSYTYLFHAIAQELSKQNIRAVWMVNNQKLRDFLEENYPKEQVLYISKKNINLEMPVIGNFKLNELIYGDRVWRHKPEDGLRFLQNIQKPIYSFLRRYNIQHIFGELTWAHEVLIHRICKAKPELNCLYFSPHVVRLPNNRFAFFTEESQDKIFEVWNEETVKEPIQVKKPTYLKLNDKIIAKKSSLWGRVDRALRYFNNKNIDKDDPTLQSDQIIRFKICAEEELRRWQYKFVKRSPISEIGNAPYVFLGLHKQPEASVDVRGRYYEDQMANIKNLWRALPHGWKLVVKEHTNAIGDRSPGWYKALTSLPNIVFVNERINSYELISNARLVATITGTIAYEASLMQIPNVTFAPVFFNKLSTSKQIGLEDLLHYDLGEISAFLTKMPDNRLEFSDYLLKNSFKGIFCDPQTFKKALDLENISLLSQAFTTIIYKSMQINAAEEKAFASFQ